MKSKIMLACLLFSLILSSCDRQPETTPSKKPANFSPDNTQVAAPKDISYPKAIAHYDVEALWEMEQQNPVSEEFREGYQQFASDSFLRIVKDTEDNLIYSPISLYVPLLINKEASKGVTQQELQNVLHTSSIRDTAEEMKHLYTRLYLDHDLGKLQIATSIWTNPKLKLKDDFVNMAQQTYYTAFYQEDLSLEQTAARMAAWVREHTGGMIDPVIKPSRSSAMQILNTIRFQMKWTNAFEKSETKEQDFYVSTGKSMKASFLNAIFMNHNYLRTSTYVSTGISLENGCTLYVILPSEKQTPESLMQDQDLITNVLNEAHQSQGEVTLHMPKVDLHSQLDLKKPLQSLGVHQMFQNTADFTEMSESSPLYVEKLQQETVLTWDEEGIEASAFTREMIEGSAAPIEDKKLDLNLNRPFIFIITKSIDQTPLPLFMGIVRNPNEE